MGLRYVVMAERRAHRACVSRAVRRYGARRAGQLRARRLARMTTLTAGAGVYALLIDGSTAEIRAAAPDDFDAVPSMHEAMSPGNL